MKEKWGILKVERQNASSDARESRKMRVLAKKISAPDFRRTGSRSRGAAAKVAHKNLFTPPARHFDVERIASTHENKKSRAMTTSSATPSANGIQIALKNAMLVQNVRIKNALPKSIEGGLRGSSNSASAPTKAASDAFILRVPSAIFAAAFFRFASVANACRIAAPMTPDNSQPK